MFNIKVTTIDPSTWTLGEIVERCKRVAFKWNPDNAHYIGTEDFKKLAAGTHRYLPDVGTVRADRHWTNDLPYVLYADRETGIVISAPNQILFSPHLHAVHTILNNGTECMLLCTKQEVANLQAIKTISKNGNI